MIYYEVWGTDTFALEDYFCGRYTSREKAYQACEENEKKVSEFQDADLRDTFCVVKISDDEINERENRNAQIEDEKSKERSYDLLDLKKCVADLLKQFQMKVRLVDVNQLLLDRKDVIFYLLADQEVDSDDGEGCFQKVKICLTYYRSSCTFAVSIEISFKRGQHYSGGNISQAIKHVDNLNDTLVWLGDPGTLEQVFTHFKILIERFYVD